MISKFTISGQQTEISFKASALTTLIQSIVGSASEYLFNHGYGDHGTEEVPIVFDDLSNQQKLDLVSAHVKRVIIDCANTHNSVQAQEAARIAEEENKLSL